MKKQFLIFAVLSQTSLLHPATSTWILDSSGNWNTSANWNPATVPNATGAVVTFGPTTPMNTAKSVTLDIAASLGTLNIDDSTAYTIANGGFSLTFQDPSETGTINITSVNGVAAHEISCPITLSSPLTINQSSTTAPGTFEISGAIGSSGTTQSLILTGGGTLILSTANSYQGGTIITSGTLSVAADAYLGMGGSTLTIAAGTLKFSTAFSLPRPIVLTRAATIDVTSGAAALSGQITGAGSLTLVDSGTLQLTNTTNSYTGGTTIGAGTLSISVDGNLGNTSGGLTIGAATLFTTSGITSARLVSLTGAAIIDTNGNTDTFSGSISGAGSLTVQGNGTVNLTGANHYTGGTTVATMTTLQGTTDGLQGNIALGAASSTLNFNQNFNGTYAGVITGAGLTSINGTAAVTFSGASSAFSGPTHIVAGSLIVDGSIASSPLTISSGATLGGNGTVGATVSNGGIISPGNGVGTLTVNGNLTLNGASNVILQIAPLSADAIDVVGTASLTGGTLTVTPTAGFYGINPCYTILTSTGLGGTSFTTVTSTSPNFVPSTTTSTADNVILCVKVLNPFFDFPFENRNTKSVGNNISALSLAGELAPELESLLNLLIGESFTTINQALDQMHPAPYSAFTELQEEMGAQIISLFHRKPFLMNSCSNSRRFWIKGFGDSLTEKTHGEEFGFTANSGGVAAGLDGELTENWTLGIGGAWNNSHLEWRDQHGHGEVNGFYGSIYTDCQISNFYFGAAVYGGVDYFDTTRHIRILTVNEKANASFHGLDIVAQLSTAYFFGAPTAYFYPYANFDFLYLHTQNFKEHGAPNLNLNVGNHTASTFRTEMGLALQVIDSNYDETISISPLFSFGWVNMFPIERENYHSTFIGESIPFTTYGWNQTWNLFSLDFGLGIYYHNFSLGLKYNVEMSADKETLLYNHFGDVRLDWKW